MGYTIIASTGNAEFGELLGSDMAEANDPLVQTKT